MASVLFLTWDGGGSAMPVLAIARVLHERGHRVHVLGHRRQAQAFMERGVPFTAYPRGGAFRLTATPANLIALMRHRDMARDVDEHLDRNPVDLVVGDPLLLSTLGVLRRRGQRYALLEPTVDTLLRMRLRQTGAVFSVFGLPVRRLLDGASAVVVASARELDAGAGPDAQHVGPMLHAVPTTAASPRLLVSLSTFRFPHLVRTWQRLLDALGEIDVPAVATLGGALDQSEVRAPSNVELRAWGDHGALMAASTAAVTHGGHGTTIAALAHGLPVLVVPLDMNSDQPGIGRIVERLGVGIALPRSASKIRLHAALEQLLHDDGLHQRARALGGRIRQYGGREAGAAALIRAANRFENDAATE